MSDLEIAAIEGIIQLAYFAMTVIGVICAWLLIDVVVMLRAAMRRRRGH